MLKLFLKLLVLAIVLLGLKTALWAYLQTYQTKRFDESSYKIDSMLKPIRSQINTVFVVQAGPRTVLTRRFSIQLRITKPGRSTTASARCSPHIHLRSVKSS
jgi:hypothetical protein